MELSLVYLLISKLGILGQGIIGYVFGSLSSRLKFEYILFNDYFVFYYLIMLSLHQYNPLLYIIYYKLFTLFSI